MYHAPGLRGIGGVAAMILAGVMPFFKTRTVLLAPSQVIHTKTCHKI
jgi:hypothetical protein